MAQFIYDYLNVSSPGLKQETKTSTFHEFGFIISFLIFCSTSLHISHKIYNACSFSRSADNVYFVDSEGVDIV